MNIHEYQAKAVLREFGVPVPRGLPAMSVDEAIKGANELGGPVWVVKAQIHAGGRGKAGGVKLAKSGEEAETIARELLGRTLVTYQTGPDGQKDIASETDAKITKTNYPKVHTDLTPDMSDLNGRPPRDEYWAKDLTLTHELVHAKDDNDNGPGAMATAKTWLDGQTATDAAGVQVHLTKIPGRFAAALLAGLLDALGRRRG